MYEAEQPNWRIKPKPPPPAHPTLLDVGGSDSEFPSAWCPKTVDNVKAFSTLSSLKGV